MSDLPILFVSIGWAERYDRTELIRGHHRWLQEHPDDCSEEAAFVRCEEDGRFWCGIGRGRIDSDRLNVVFVSRHPKRTGHLVVGVYYEAELYSDEDAAAPFYRAAAARVRYFTLEERNIRVEWPQGQGMRRWAHRAGSAGKEHPALYRTYRNLLERLDPARTARG